MSGRSRILRVSKFDSTVGLFSGNAQARSNTSLQQPSRRVSGQILRDLTSFVSNLAPEPGEHSLGVRAEK